MPSKTTVTRIEMGIVAVTVGLVLIGFANGVLVELFGAQNRGRWDLISERTVPAAWSSALFLLASALMLFAAWRTRQSGTSRARWWIAMAFVAFAAALDEFFSFHERTIEPVRDLLGVSGLLLYAWVIPGAAILLAVALTFARFVKGLERPVRRRLVGGAALLVVGGVGMEMVGGWWAQEIGVGFGWMVVYTLEEALEFAGAVLIVFAMARFHLDHRPPFVDRRRAERRQVARGRDRRQSGTSARQVHT